MADLDDTPAVRSFRARNTDERRLTVGAVPDDYRPVNTERYRVPPPLPAIKLKGKWLHQAGFSITSPIRVRVMRGCLVITLD